MRRAGGWLSARRFRVRRWALAVIVLVGAGTLPGNAAAVTLVLDGVAPRPEPYQGWADRAHVPTPRGLVTLRLAECPLAGPAACVTVSTPAEIFLGRYGRTRPALLHELGHVFDRAMPGWARTRFAALIDDRRPWTAAPNSPHERFAEAYRACALHRRLRSTYRGAYGYTVRPAQHARVCVLIRAAGA